MVAAKGRSKDSSPKPPPPSSHDEDDEEDVSIPDEMADFIVPDDEEDEEEKEFSPCSTTDEETGEETDDETEDETNKKVDKKTNKKTDKGSESVSDSKGEREVEDDREGIDVSNLLPETDNGICSRSRRNVRPPQRLVDDMTSTSWYKEQVMVDVGTSAEEIAYALEDENWTEEETETEEEEEEEEDEEEESSQEEKKRKEKKPASKAKRAREGGLTYRAESEANCYVCCYVSDQVIEMIKKNPTTRYFINANSYNLNGDKANESNDSKMYDIENGGRMEKLLSFSNVYFVNPAQLPLLPTDQEDPPMSTCMNWIQSLYTQLSAELKRKGNTTLSDAMKGYIFDVTFAMGKLKEVGSGLTDQNDIATFKSHVQTLNMTFETLKKTQPEDAIDRWAELVRDGLAKVKQLVGEETYKNKKRMIEKMYGAILPGIALLNNDAMGMSYLMANGLTQTMKKQSKARGELLAALQVLRPNLKEFRENARQRFLKVFTPLDETNENAVKSQFKAILKLEEEMETLNEESIKKQKEQEVKRIAAEISKLTAAFDDPLKTTFLEMLNNLESVNFVKVKNVDLKKVDLNKMRKKLATKTKLPDKDDYFNFLLDEMTNFSDRMSEKAKSTLDDMNPMKMMQSVQARQQKMKDAVLYDAEFFTRTHGETFDQILTDLEGDDTTAILYGLLKNPNMMVTIQVGSELQEDMRETISTVLNSIGVPPEQLTPPIVEEMNMGNTKKVIENLTSLCAILNFANGTQDRGAFYVAGGVDLIPRIGKLMQSASQVWMSIDAHPKDHVSFFTAGENSTMYFPPHCVDGTVGQCLVRGLYEKGIDKDKTTFFWKACDSEMDSFGAFPYQDNAFCNGNSLEGGTSARKICLKHDHDKITTGGFVVANLTPGDKGSVNHKILYHTPPEQRLQGRSIIDVVDRLKEGGKVPQIFVCGLAGDWCVLDTCVNLKKKYKQEVDVVFLADFVQYSILPTQIFNDVDGEPNAIDPTLYPMNIDASSSVNELLGSNKHRWLNHPDQTFGLLIENGVKIAWDETNHKENLFRHYMNAGTRIKNDIDGEEAKQLFMNNMDINTIKTDIANNNAILFVIDMQNDFAVPPSFLQKTVNDPFLLEGLITDRKLNRSISSNWRRVASHWGAIKKRAETSS